MMNAEQLTAFLKEKLKTISNSPQFAHVQRRLDVGTPITADAINSFVERNGLLNIGNAWIELSRNSASEYLRDLMDGESQSWFGYYPPQEPIQQAVSAFIDFLNTNALFLTNGLISRLTEYPVRNERTLEIEVTYPFPSPRVKSSQYNVFNSLTNEIDTSLFAVVAVDEFHIGFIGVASCF